MIVYDRKNMLIVYIMIIQIIMIRVFFFEELNQDYQIKAKFIHKAFKTWKKSSTCVNIYNLTKSDLQVQWAGAV